MLKPWFPRRLLQGLSGAVILIFLFLPNAMGQNSEVDEAGIHNQQGIQYFKKGFYIHAPRNEVAYAQKNYMLAVKEFKDAISKDLFYTEAHRNLARVYYVQKDFDGAAEEYKRVTELAPSDLDAYVNLALALIELQRTDEAIQALKDAKGQTSDPKALAMLDSYLAKVRAHQPKEVR